MHLSGLGGRATEYLQTALEAEGHDSSDRSGLDEASGSSMICTCALLQAIQKRGTIFGRRFTNTRNWPRENCEGVSKWLPGPLLHLQMAKVLVLWWLHLDGLMWSFALLVLGLVTDFAASPPSQAAGQPDQFHTAVSMLAY